MSDMEHRAGVKEANLVLRHIKLSPGKAEDTEAAVTAIDQTLGVDGVSFDEESQILNIAYDATKLSVDTIEDILANHNLDISHDWWTHIKEGYYRFVDRNIKDNDDHEPWIGNNRPKL